MSLFEIYFAKVESIFNPSYILRCICKCKFLIGLQPLASGSSVPKSTSSMTLPVSSPSSHSQFDDATHTIAARAGVPELTTSQAMMVGGSAPQHIENRLDQLTRLEMLINLPGSNYLTEDVYRWFALKFFLTSIQLKSNSCRPRILKFSINGAMRYQ